MNENKWCEYCGCHIDVKVICSNSRHKYSVTNREENNKKFPYPILVDYYGNIIENGKLKLPTPSSH